MAAKRSLNAGTGSVMPAQRCLIAGPHLVGLEYNLLYVFLNPFEPEFTIVISSTTSRELLPQFSTCSG